MSPPRRPKREYRSAQREYRSAQREYRSAKREYRSAKREGTPVSARRAGEAADLRRTRRTSAAPPYGVAHAAVGSRSRLATAIDAPAGKTTPFFTAVTSASIETAISGGVRLPM